MNAALPFFFLVWFLSGKGGDLTTWAPRPTPRPPPRPPRRPSPAPPTSTWMPAPPSPEGPWPQAVPPGLPPFPGGGWEPDEPPPKEVVTRAGQLLGALWKNGAGAFKIERTGARWIAYRATKMGAKKGVVAYRLKYPGAGVPKTVARPGETLTLEEGQRYTLLFRAPDMPAAAAESLRAHLATHYPDVNVLAANVRKAEGMTWVQVDLIVLKTQTVRMGAMAPVLGHQVLLAKVLRRVPEKPGTSTPIATPVSTVVQTPTGRIVAKSPIELPTLRVGRGLKPKAPDANVRVLQSKLGIEADGRFGSGTLHAVKAFQQRRGLTDDGVVGPKTWTALFGTQA